MTQKNQNKSSSSGFQFILKWSGIFFVALILIGFIYRLLVPVKLNLNENDYIKRVFTTEEAEIYPTVPPDFSIEEMDAGTILYVIEEQEEYFMIRPFIRTHLDSVWISKESVSDYSAEQYKQWQQQQDLDRFGLDEDEDE